jgi:type IV pilus assembly protein PilV
MLTMKQAKRLAARQSGMTLIEVLVAILIFSFGLLGFVGLQAKAIQFSVGAEDTNRASLLANDLAANMQLAQTTALPAATITAWQAQVANAAVAGLNNGVGTVTTQPLGGVLITITWQTPGTVPTATTTHQFVTQVFIP